MRKALLIAGALAGAVVLSTVAASAQDGEAGVVRVELRDGTGQLVGTVTLEQSAPNAVDVQARTRAGLRSGWHGFHVHAVGRCEGPTFATAGGHVKVGDQVHGRHAGDLAPLLVKGNGTATARITTDGFTLASLRDADGAALIVHLGPDNLASVPARYAPAGPDADTLNTGDAGGRAACGVIAAPAG